MQSLIWLRFFIYVNEFYLLLLYDYEVITQPFLIMKIGEYLRYNTFWLLDKLKGGPLKNKLNYTKDILTSSDLSYVKQVNNMRLTELLNHAISTTYYYNGKTYSSLEEFPIINKNIIRDHLSDFMSDKFAIKDLVKVSTSGSTGAPFSIYHNKDKIYKSIADNIFFSSKSNYQIGNHLVYIKIWKSKFDFMTRYGFILKNIYAYSIFNLTDEEIDLFINQLNKNENPISFIGYSSAFEKICYHLDDLESNPIEFKTKSLITISEALSPYAKEAIEKYFGIRPLSRYSNNENGIIAQQTNDDGLKFRVNDSSYIVEIFDMNEDKKLGYGQQGRIVITDLFNKATPIIRYDTGDVGTLELDEDGRPFFTEIYGRKLDLLYNTMGEIVPSHLSSKLVKYGNFRQFQLVQKGLKEYEVNLNTDKKIDEESLINEYKGYLGDDAKIKINYVDEIPLLASGKRREVVNEYYTY